MWGGEIWEGAEGTESEHRLHSAMNAPQERTFSQPRGKTLYQVPGSRGREGLDVGQTHEANHFHWEASCANKTLDSRPPFVQLLPLKEEEALGEGNSFVPNPTICATFDPMIT